MHQVLDTKYVALTDTVSSVGALILHVLNGTSWKLGYVSSDRLCSTAVSVYVMTCVHRYQERWNLSGRILGSLAVSLLTFVTCGIFVLAEEVNSTLLFFCTMGLIVMSGLSTAVLQVRYSQQAPVRFFSAACPVLAVCGVAQDYFPVG